MEIKATINYGDPLHVDCEGGSQELTISRAGDKITLGWDEMNDLVQICKMLEWEDF